MQRILVLFGCLMAMAGRPAFAQEESSFPQAEDSPFALKSDFTSTRSDVFMPLGSFILPGLGQWVEGQYAYGALYTGVAIGGTVYALEAIANNDVEGNRERQELLFEEAGEDYVDLGPFGDDFTERRIAFGSQLYQSMGGFSAYHSFRTAVRSRKAQGQYDFLSHEETPGELFLAPFDFSYVTRKTTWIPLLVIGGLSYLQATAEIPEDFPLERKKFNGSDALFTLGFSYNAGTHEEALFRGWMQPMLREYTGSYYWSNGIQAAAFAAAHLGSNEFPLAQLLLGYHLGYVTAEDQWRIGEAIFIHTWWDVFAFAATYHYKRKLPEAEAAMINPTLWLPTMKWYF